MSKLNGEKKGKKIIKNFISNLKINKFFLENFLKKLFFQKLKSRKKVNLQIIGNVFCRKEKCRARWSCLSVECRSKQK